MVARKSKQKNILAGYEDFQEKLDEFDIMLKDSVAESTEGQKRYQRDWQILRLYHQRESCHFNSPSVFLRETSVLTSPCLFKTEGPTGFFVLSFPFSLGYQEHDISTTPTTTRRSRGTCTWSC